MGPEHSAQISKGRLSAGENQASMLNQAVRVVGMTFEMRAQGLDAGIGILGQFNPVLRSHAAPAGRLAELFNAWAKGAG